MIFKTLGEIFHQISNRFWALRQNKNFFVEHRVILRRERELHASREIIWRDVTSGEGGLHSCRCHSQCESRYVNNESSHVGVSGCIRNQELSQKWYVCQIPKNKQKPKYFFRLEFDVQSLIAAAFFVAVFGLPCSAFIFLCLIGNPVKKLVHASGGKLFGYWLHFLLMGVFFRWLIKSSQNLFSSQL